MNWGKLALGQQYQITNSTSKMQHPVPLHKLTTNQVMRHQSDFKSSSAQHHHRQLTNSSASWMAMVILLEVSEETEYPTPSPSMATAETLLNTSKKRIHLTHS